MLTLPLPLLKAFAYIMHEDRPIGVPSIYYMKTCLEGYDTFYFDKQILLNAYKNSMEMCENEKWNSVKKMPEMRNGFSERGQFRELIM